jgi:hypothetical protein
MATKLRPSLTLRLDIRASAEGNPGEVAHGRSVDYNLST